MILNKSLSKSNLTKVTLATAIAIGALVPVVVCDVTKVEASTPNAESDFDYTKSFDLISGGDVVTITGYKGTSKDVVIPSTVEGVAVKSIGEHSFMSKGITSVVIPDSVADIGTQAFGTNQLTSVVIPDSVKSIGGNAFASNPLTSVVIEGENIIFNRGVFVPTRPLTNVDVTIRGIVGSTSETYANNNGHPFNPLNEEDLIKYQDVTVNIESGGLHLSTSPITSFGEIELTEQPEIHNTSFSDSLNVQDLRGSQEGWSLTVSATTFANGDHELPSGSLTLDGLASIERVEQGVGTLPDSELSSTAVIDDGAVLVANAKSGTGMGVFDLDFNTDALGLTVDATTAKAKTYTSTLTWTLASTPTAN